MVIRARLVYQNRKISIDRRSNRNSSCHNNNGQTCTQSTVDKNYKIKYITNDQFKEGKMEDKYNCVMLSLMKEDITVAEVEAQ